MNHHNSESYDFPSEDDAYNLDEDLAEFHYDVAMIVEEIEDLERYQISGVAMSALQKSSERPEAATQAALNGETVIYKQDIDEAAAEHPEATEYGRRLTEIEPEDMEFHM